MLIRLVYLFMARVLGWLVLLARSEVVTEAARLDNPDAEAAAYGPASPAARSAAA